jgi:hypothetical protein
MDGHRSTILKCNPFVVRTVVQRICSLLKIYAFGNVETVVLITSCITFTEYLEKYKRENEIFIFAWLWFAIV